MIEDTQTINKHSIRRNLRNLMYIKRNLKNIHIDNVFSF